MPNIPQIQIGNTTYKVKDADFRNNAILASSSQPSQEENRLWINESASEEYQVPTQAEFEDLKSVVKYPNIFVENGNLSTIDGGELNDDTMPFRLRTGFIKFNSYPTTVRAANGYKFAYRTFLTDFSFSGTGPAATERTFSAERYVRLMILKDDGTEISPSELSSAISSGLENAYCVVPTRQLIDKVTYNDKAINNRVDYLTQAENAFYEVGNINVAGEELDDTTNRIRTGYIRFNIIPVTITAGSGYEFSLRRYDDDFQYNSGLPTWHTTLTITNGNYAYNRIIVRRTDGKNISLDEFDNAITSGLENADFVIPARQVIKKITELEDKKYNQYNLNRNMVGNSDMVWEYQNWVFPQVLSYQGIRNRLYFGFTTETGYAGIAQYDYDTNELTKTLLKKNSSGGDGSTDDHNLMAITMLPNRKILCAFAGGHNGDTSMHIRIAGEREGIGSFEDEIRLSCSGRASYAQIFNYDGKLYLFYRLENAQWFYRVGTNNGTTWTDQTKLIYTSEQMYCQFAETNTPGILRVCCYTNPSGSDTAIRMGYLHLDNMTLYGIDNSTVIGASNVQLSSIPIVIPAPSNGKVNRLYRAAKTDVGTAKILYCVFTNSEGTIDGVYYLYDSGTTVEIVAAGTGLWIPKTQLGAEWIGDNKIAIGRGYEGSDLIEIYDYQNGEITFDRTVASHVRVSNGSNHYRTARPMCDNNQKALIYYQGYSNPNSYIDFTTDGHIYSLETNQLLI